MVKIINNIKTALTRPISWIYIATSAIILSLLAVVYGVFRGFDWTDEAWAYSLISSGRVTLGEPWAFQYLMNPILQLAGDHVLAIRGIRFIAFLGLGVLVSIAFGVISKSVGKTLTKTAWIILFSTTQLGTVLVWSWPPRYFAYNEINSIIVQLVAVAIALLMFTERINSQYKLTIAKFTVIWISIGIVTGILFYGRFTGFLLLAPIAFIATFFSEKGRRLLSICLYSASALFGILFPVAVGLPLVEYVNSIWINLTDAGVRAANNHPSGLVQMYAENLWGTFLTILPVMIMSLTGVLLVLGVFTENHWKPGYFRQIGYIFLGLSGVISFIYVLQSGGGAERTGKIAIFGIALAAVLLFVFGNSRSTAPNGLAPGALDSWRIFCAVSLIVIAPIVASFGTNNPLSLHFGFDSTIWTGAAGLGIALWFTASIQGDKSAWPPVLAFLLVGSLSVVAIIGEARVPYRSASFKANSELITNSGPLQGLYVTPAEKKWLDWLQTQSKELSADNVPTLSLKSAGALLAFNNSSFASPWLESFWPASFWSVTKACQISTPKDLIILVPGTVPEGSPEWNDLQSTLSKSCGFSFPSDFKDISHINASDPLYSMTIWRLRK